MVTVVLEPNTGTYYILSFTSTISASVARADIATHANFPGNCQVTDRPLSEGRFRRCLPDHAQRPLASDIFFFDQDVASGLDWLGYGRHNRS